MTAVPHEPTPPRRRLFSSRRGRVAAVLALCLITLPITGFWVDVNDAGRGIAALRMRLDPASAPDIPDSAPLAAPFPRDAGVRPLSLDKARYRATLRDMPKTDLGLKQPGTKSFSSNTVMSLHNNQVSLALADKTYLPLRRISNVRPSQVYDFWTKSGTFLPADGHHRNADPTGTAWLTDPDWTPGSLCETSAETSLSADMRRLVYRMRAPFSPLTPHPKSRRYMDMITHASKRFGLTPQLIYAIMRTESAFNPFAVSNAGALGLMQLVPDTAGNEVHAYLTGKQGKPTRTMLFDPQSNIEYGSAYLHLLATRYFAAVTNRASRELCMIAGYNAGPSAVLKVFGNNTEEAVSAINALDPETLLATLVRKMPAEETRQYIGRVLASIDSFPR